MTCKLSLGIQKSIDFDDSWMKWILWDFLFKNINTTPIKQSHTNPWDFVILFQTLICHHLVHSIFLLLSLSLCFLFFIFKDSFFLFVKFIKSLYIFDIISFFFFTDFVLLYDFLSFSMPCFLFPISCFFYWFFFMICCFICPIFLYAKFFFISISYFFSLFFIFWFV